MKTKDKIPDPLLDQVEALANQLMADVKDAYEDGDEVAAFRALERLKVGAEALSNIANVADYLGE